MTFDLQSSIDVLERTPAALRSLLAGLGDGWTRSNYGPDTFSPFDVVGHLIHADRTNWVPRARLILTRGESEPFPPFDRYAMRQTSRGKSTADLLDEFAAVRAQSVSDLRSLNLTDALLDRQGAHPDLGRVTVRQLLATWVVHDLHHLHQIAKAMAFQYRDAVGPWRRYLSILPAD